MSELDEYVGERVAIDKATGDSVRLTKRAMQHLNAPPSDLLVVPCSWCLDLYDLPQMHKRIVGGRLVVELSKF